MAFAAYDVAALALKGTYAILHFPESIISNTLPECPTTGNIRAAAARAAAAQSSVYESDSKSMKDVRGRVAAPPGVYMDEEAVFGMSNLLSEMAEGMLYKSPKAGFSSVGR